MEHLLFSGMALFDRRASFIAKIVVKMQLPAGLGARHLVDVAVAAHIVAPAVVVSAIDGDLSAFSEGRMRL
jgi:DNA integrity scanning protein DisA with diadenylate cyclase activity